MSGKAGFSMKVDMEPMVAFMPRMQRRDGRQGRASPPQAEIDEVEEEMLASRKIGDDQPLRRTRRSQKKLPAGDQAPRQPSSRRTG